MIASVCVSLAACGSSKSEAKSPASEQDVPQAKDAAELQCKSKTERAAETGVEGAKTGVLTAGKGIETFGKSTAGLLEGGKDEAKSEWKKGSKETKKTARKGAKETKKTAHQPTCD